MDRLGRKALLGRVWTDNETIQKHVLVHKLSLLALCKISIETNKETNIGQFDIINKYSLSAKHRGERIKCRFIWQRPRIIYTNTSCAENKKK